MRDRNWLYFRVGIEIGLFFVRWSKLTSFLYAGRILLGFNVLTEIDLVCVRAVESDSAFVCSPKMT